MNSMESRCKVIPLHKTQFESMSFHFFGHSFAKQKEWMHGGKKRATFLFSNWMVWWPQWKIQYKKSISTQQEVNEAIERCMQIADTFCRFGNKLVSNNSNHNRNQWMDGRERFIRFDFKAILKYTPNAHNIPKNKYKPIYQSYGGKLKNVNETRLSIFIISVEM